VDTREKKKKRTSKKNVDGRCTSSHENKTFRSISVVKRNGVWVPEDGDSGHKTGKIDEINRTFTALSSMIGVTDELVNYGSCVEESLYCRRFSCVVLFGNSYKNR
jgi:hypothetical protein